MIDEQRKGFLHKIVGWLRAGYPEGVPDGDYVALFGVLRRKLTEEDIEAIVEELTADRPVAISHDEIHDFILAHAMQQPKKKDIARVSARLAAGGWPLGDPEDEQGGEDDDPEEPGQEPSAG